MGGPPGPLPRSVWSGIAEAARHDFNERLRQRKIATSRWKTGPNLVDRLLGKELCVLAWAAAVSYTHLRAHETVLDLVCRLLLEKKNNMWSCTSGKTLHLALRFHM